MIFGEYKFRRGKVIRAFHFVPVGVPSGAQLLDLQEITKVIHLLMTKE